MMILWIRVSPKWLNVMYSQAPDPSPHTCEAEGRSWRPCWCWCQSCLDRPVCCPHWCSLHRIHKYLQKHTKKTQSVTRHQHNCTMTTWWVLKLPDFALIYLESTSCFPCFTAVKSMQFQFKGFLVRTVHDGMCCWMTHLLCRSDGRSVWNPSHSWSWWEHQGPWAHSCV